MNKREESTKKWCDIFSYSDGTLKWKVRPARRMKIGDADGYMKDYGYMRVRCRGGQYYVHRIIWEMHNGHIPKGMEVDHINHVRTDNRIENLRLVSRLENCKNRKLNSNNTSGFNGVSWSKSDGKWLAYIYINKKRIRLGLFSDISKAIAAREKANLSHQFHKNHGGRA